jgi:Zn-dependent oligopeptidase
MGVKNSDELRKAHEAVQPAVVRFNQELGQNQALFKCLESMKADEALWNSLDEAQHRIVDCAIRDMTKSGVGLPDSMRPLFNEFQLEVSELSTKFSNNVLDSTKAFKLTLIKPSDVEGLPPSARALLSKQAVSDGFVKVSIGFVCWCVDSVFYLPALLCYTTDGFYTTDGCIPNVICDVLFIVHSGDWSLGGDS